MAALVPSAGTITLQIELRLDADALSTPHPVRTRAARVPTHRNAKIMEVLSILRGPSLTRLLPRRYRQRCRDDDSWLTGRAVSAFTLCKARSDAAGNGGLNGCVRLQHRG